MLQQTRVETVIPYYGRFLEAFPTVEALATATEDEVRAQWSGLGYYRRARSLLQAARQVSATGTFPATLEGWLELPGVGRYTAAAIVSIVHGLKVAAIDGNLERVLSRIEAFDKDPKTAAGRLFMEQAAEIWMDLERPGDSNQALMELGATICRPKRPLCRDCPLVDDCAAFQRGEPEEFPLRRSRRRVVERELLAIAIRQEDRFLLFRRCAESEILGGTWEMPWVDATESSPARALGRRYGGDWKLGEPRGAVRHSITHRLLKVTVTEGELLGGGQLAEGPEARWADLAELDRLPHSSLVRKAMLVALPAR